MKNLFSVFIIACLSFHQMALPVEAAENPKSSASQDTHKCSNMADPACDDNSDGKNSPKQPQSPSPSRSSSSKKPESKKPESKR